MRLARRFLETITLSVLMIATGVIAQVDAKGGQLALSSDSSLLDVAFYGGVESAVNLGDFTALRKAHDIIVSDADGDVSFDFTHSPSFLGAPDRVFVDLGCIDFDLPTANSTRSSRGPKGSVSSVPEPASMLLLGTGLSAAIGIARARRQRNLK